MSRQAGSIVRGISKPRRISVKAGRQQVAAMYCGRGQRSRSHGSASGNWQEWQGSNLRPPVLETGALPTELHSCEEPSVAADPRRFKHRPWPDCKGEAVNALFNPNVFCARLGHTPTISIRPTTRAKGENHDRANRRQTPRRPADPAAAPGQTGIARAFAGPAAADVGRVQARDRQGNHCPARP